MINKKRDVIVSEKKGNIIENSQTTGKADKIDGCDNAHSSATINGGRSVNRSSGSGALFAFFGTCVGLLLVIAILVVTIDPFFHYHKPIEGFPYIVDNQLSQNPGMAENMIYDSAIVGSSMTVNFNTNDFANVMGLNTIKLSYSGALPRDDYNILSFIYDEDSYSRQNGDVKAIFMVIDPNVMTADINATKYELPTYLYDDNIFNDVNYIFNKDVLFQYILKPVIQRRGTDLSTVYYSWWTPEYYNELWVMPNYTPAEKVSEKTPVNAYIKDTATNLEKNILPFIQEHEETTFYIFFAPYSVLYWYDVVQENHLDATLYQTEYIAGTLLSYDNVRLFDFMDNEEIITDINNYADEIHYKPEYNAWMVQCFNDGIEEIFEGDIEKDMQHLRSIIESYDYETLFEKYEVE